MNEIDMFSGKYHFLSNFSMAEVWLDGESYPSTEHAFQAAKTLDTKWRRKIAAAATPKLARKLGRQAPLRDNWEEIKDKEMYELVRQKFMQHPELSEKLLETGDRYLEEGNWWHDTYWGVCNGEGLNKLGQILMQVRQEIKDKINE